MPFTNAVHWIQLLYNIGDDEGEHQCLPSVSTSGKHRILVRYDTFKF